MLIYSSGWIFISCFHKERKKRSLFVRFTFHFQECLGKTLEKYQKYSYGAVETSYPMNDMSSYQEYLRLKSKVEVLQRSQRNLLGDDLAQMNTQELDQLENQVEAALKNIRSTKTQYMLDQLADLQNREKMLDETNRALRSKLEEGSNSQVPLRLGWDAAGTDHIHYPRFPPQSEGFFQPLGHHPSLQIGYDPVGADDVNVGGPALNNHGFVSGWML